MGILKIGTLTEAARSDPPVGIIGRFVLVAAGEGTVTIDRRVQGGAWRTISKDPDGNAASYVLAAGVPLVLQLEELVGEAEYSINCSDFTADIDWEFQQ